MAAPFIEGILCTGCLEPFSASRILGGVCPDSEYQHLYCLDCCIRTQHCFCANKPEIDLQEEPILGVLEVVQREIYCGRRNAAYLKKLAKRVDAQKRKRATIDSFFSFPMEAAIAMKTKKLKLMRLSEMNEGTGCTHRELFPFKQTRALCSRCGWYTYPGITMKESKDKKYHLCISCHRIHGETFVPGLNTIQLCQGCSGTTKMCEIVHCNTCKMYLCEPCFRKGVDCKGKGKEKEKENDTCISACSKPAWMKFHLDYTS